MENIGLTLSLFWLAISVYRLIRSQINAMKLKREALENEEKSKRIAYHVEYAVQLRNQAIITNDVDYLDYSNQELDKADKIVETLK